MDRWFVMTSWAVHWAKDPEAICEQSITPVCEHEQRRSASGRRSHIPPNLVVECVLAHRKPPEVRICRLTIQSVVGKTPPSTSTPH